MTNGYRVERWHKPADGTPGKWVFQQDCCVLEHAKEVAKERGTEDEPFRVIEPAKGTLHYDSSKDA